jgi:hypothetical protein
MRFPCDLEVFDVNDNDLAFGVCDVVDTFPPAASGVTE